jgi:hypothetical protein
MSYPYQITVINYQRFKESDEDIQFGHYFVFRQVREQKRFADRLRLRKNPSVHG